MRWRVTAREPKGRDGKNCQLRYFSPEGKQRQRSSGTPNIGEAWEIARAEERRLNQEELPFPRVAKAYLAFRRDSESARPLSLLKFDQALRRVHDYLGDSYPTKEALLQVQDAMLTTPTAKTGRPLSAKVVNNYLGIAGSAWGWAHERGIVQAPWPGPRRLKEAPTKKRPCSREESAEILADFHEHEAALYPVLCFLADTGARVTETLHLRGRDVDRDRLVARLWVTKTESRSVPVGADVVDILPSPGPAELLFPRKDGGPREHYEVRDAWNRAMRRTGLKGQPISPHSLRKTYITASLDTIGLKDSMRITGHKSVKVHMDYARLSVSNRLQEAAEAVRAQRLPLPHTTPTPCGGGHVDCKENQVTKEIKGPVRTWPS